ncbi:MAG: hypothetical protein V9F00_00750 [Nocardioides sp.]
MNESVHITESANAGALRERTLDDMANAYSRRAREARAKQGKPPVIVGPGVLQRLAEIMALEDPQSQRKGLPAA